MKRAVVYEPWAKGLVHSQFLKCFLIMISEIYDEVIFVGDDSVIIELKKNDFKNISFKSVSIVNCETLKGKFTSLLKEKKNIKLLKNISNNNDIFITCGIPYTIYWCNKLLKANKLYYVMHGGLEYVEKKISPIKLYYYLKKQLNNLSENSKLIVLGDSIKDNLTKKLEFLKDSIISIDHPYLSSDSFENKNEKKSNNSIKIGTIGVATLEKGNMDIIDISKFLKQRKFDNIELYHIGKINAELQIIKNYVHLPFDSQDLIESSSFNEEIHKLDYFLFLYPSSNYKYTASGALFDAFVHGKPIVAIKNDFFEYFFNKYPGIGFLYDSIEDLCEGILKLPQIDSFEYNYMVKMCKITLQNVSPYVLAETLKCKLGDDRC